MTGVICSYTKVGLEAGSDYTYYFVAQDDQGNPATPTTELDAPDVTSATYRLFVPIAMKNAAPPSAPVLEDITNSNGISTYTVNWSPVNGATSYTLEEDDHLDFSNPITVYPGTVTSKSISVKELGTYYYRVKASNISGSSPWSNVVSVQVTTILPGVIPQPGTWNCRSVDSTVHFTVSPDSSSVSDGLILGTPCGPKSITGPVPIEDSKFTLIHEDGLTFISATFEEEDFASGSYGIVSGSCWQLGTMTCSP
jgi:hypothetical protein